MGSHSSEHYQLKLSNDSLTPTKPGVEEVLRVIWSYTDECTYSQESEKEGVKRKSFCPTCQIILACLPCTLITFFLVEYIKSTLYHTTFLRLDKWSK